ncbi:MAG: hypothetical protein JRF71_12930 [Deltaproteobacteria bacterium]|nr:hypothetical protein [Deltaproteobacteria bacterium]MBW2201718.1 hypothetical protein [Deltaproteobacteria bacterium]MBW2539693.1 hypothetical protein [Deltaproteobacteria bacterium]
MSCYFKHMKDILKEGGVEVNQGNKEIDKIIRRPIDVEYKHCSPAWKAVKELIKTDDKGRRRFIKRLAKTLKVI